MQTNSDEKILAKKRKKFEEAVVAACEKLHVAVPYLNFEGCPEEGGNRSHFHPEEYKICVSRYQLYRLNFDDIFDVATHEVSHIFEQGHDNRFMNIHQNTRVKLWKPPQGIVVIKNGKKQDIIIKRKKVKPNECRYHLCKKEGKRRCKYCKELFCTEHAKPTYARYDPKGKTKYEPVQGDVVGGHPCPAWTQKDYWMKRAEELFNNAKYDALMGRTYIELELERRYRSMDNEVLIKLKPMVEKLVEEENRKHPKVYQKYPERVRPTISKPKGTLGIISSFFEWLKRKL